MTASPRMCHIAIRPCMAATLASISTPVQSPAAYTPRAVVRETRSTLMNPPSSRATPASSSPRSAVLGIEPSASRQCEPVTVRPSVSVTVTSSPSRVTDSIRDLESTSMPRRLSTSSRTCAASASSPGQHPVARGDQHHLDAEGVVGTGELRAGDAGADHDQLRGALGEVVDLLPGEDALAVRLGGRQGARCGAGGQEYGVGLEGLRLAVLRLHDHRAAAVEPSPADAAPARPRARAGDRCRRTGPPRAS